MSININSINECKIAYIEHLRCVKAGKPSPLSGKDLGDIERVYGDKTARWAEIANTSRDISEYVIDDDDYNAAVGRGRQYGEDSTGFDGNMSKAKGRGSGDMIWTAAGAAGTAAGLGIGATAGKEAAKKAAEEAAKNAMKEGIKESTTQIGGKAISTSVGQSVGQQAAQAGAEKTAAEATKQIGKTVGALIGCVMAFATGMAYLAKNPNKKEVESAMKLKEETFVESTQKLDDAVATMDEATAEAEEKADEADALNAETQEDIVDEKANYDMLMRTYIALRQKADSGEALTEEEKALFEYVCKSMSEAGINIEELQNKNADELNAIYSDMDAQLDIYDSAAETMGEVQGVTDYAESFDDSTKTMCIVESVAQGINVASGTAAVVEGTIEATAGSAAFGLGSWMWAFVAMGAAGVAASVKGMAEQIKWAGQVGDEINARKDLTSMNVETNDIYEDQLENYDILKDGVTDLELEIPDEIAAPDATLPPPPTETGVPEGTPNPVNPNNTANGGTNGTDDDKNPFKPKDERTV